MPRTTADRQAALDAVPTPVTATAVVGELALRLANQVIVACAEHGIVVMPLKGVLLLARWPVLRGARDLVDVDFLVRPQDIQTVRLVLRQLGFEETVPSSAGSTFANDAWPLSIDMHRALFPHGLFAASTDGIFGRAEIDESLYRAPVARMSDDDLFAHLIGHFVKGRGRFVGDKSLDDIRWLLGQGSFRIDDAKRLGAHFRELGLQRAAGYALDHESFRDQPVARAVVRSLRLSLLDRTTIAIARMGADAKEGAPRWWTPHLLDRSVVAGSRSLVNHADEAMHRLVGHAMEAAGGVLRGTSADH